MKIRQRSTAINSYYAIAHDLPRRRRQVFEQLIQLGEACNHQISRRLRLPINQITPRMNELVKLGLVEESCRKIYKRTNTRVIYWKAVEI